MAAAAIVLMTVIAYLPVSENGEIWDDNYYVTANENLSDGAGLLRMWTEPGVVPQYYPLTYTSFWIEHQFWKLDLRHYHWHNVILHALNAVLWMVLLRQLGLSAVTCWLAAAIFALHPVHVESAAWISERKNVQSTLFYLLATLAYLRFGERGCWRWYAASLALFACALLSKTVTASLPAAMLLVIYWRRGRLRWSDASYLAPFFLLGIAMGMVTIYMEKHHINARGPDWDYSFLERCLIAGRALLFYPAKLLWPAKLTFIYPQWKIDVTNWRQYFYPLMALGVIVLLWLRRERIGRGPLVAVLFFAGTLFPALGFIDVFPMRYSFVADHFQYLASMGLIAMAAAMLARRRWGVAILLAALPLLGVLTYRQTHMYKDMETLWTETIERNPTAWMAHNNLGVALSKRGDDDGAVASFRQSIALKRDHVVAICNLGESLAALHRDDEAIVAYRHALQINPNYGPAHAEFGHVLLERNELTQAAHHLQEALRRNRNDGQSWHNLGVVRLRQGDQDKGVEYLNRAVKLDPDNAKSFQALAKAHLQRNTPASAEKALRRAVELDPGYAMAHHDLGYVLAMQRRLPQATASFRTAVRLAPDSARFHHSLGVSLEQGGRADQAIAALERSVALDPNYAPALRALAWMLATHWDEQLHDGNRAVTIATKANKATGGGDIRSLDVLAAALAEVGRFKEAAQTAEAALTRAKTKGSRPQIESIQRRLEYYRSDRPYRTPEP